MKIISISIITSLLFGGIFAKMYRPEKKIDTPFYVGTYTQKESQGIYQYSLQHDGTLIKIGLVAKAENPSFLAKSPDQKFLVAVNEIGSNDAGGTVESYAIEKDGLKLIDKKSSGGKFPCFVTINKEGFVITANYGNGTIGLLKLKNDGKLSDLLDVQQHTGSGTTERQKGPHAHSAWFEDNDKDIISIDLGTNELWFSQIDINTEKLVPKSPEKMKMPKGAGPRHMVFHPNGKWAYVVNELSSTVSVLEKTDTAHYQVNASIPTLPKDYKGTNSCADIQISKDGKFVYASNRGHDSIVIYKVNPLDGSLTLVAYEPTRGKVPRNFSLSPNDDFLIVANQETNSIVSFKRNTKKGTLKFIDEIESPTPVCILF